MARKKKDEEEEFVIGSSSKVTSGEVNRYEVRIAPPTVSGGRKVKPVREPGEAAATPGGGAPGAGAAGQRTDRTGIGGVPGVGTQQIFKIEDDLRRTREIMEDLKHTSSILEGDVRDLKAEMERINYLLKSLEGLRNSLKDIESTVSELSGLYDLISANVNPFIDIPPMRTKQEHRAPASRECPEPAFVDANEVFNDLEEVEEGDTLESEEWILRWTKFLIDRVGKEGLERTLEYYLEMKWVDEQIMDRVFNAARGIASTPRSSDPNRRVTWKLEAEDHIQSLDFIKRIKGSGGR